MHPERTTIYKQDEHSRHCLSDQYIQHFLFYFAWKSISDESKYQVQIFNLTVKTDYLGCKYI